MIAEIAKGYVGTRFRHQGRTPGVGLDCAGILVCALRSIGLPVNDPRSYRKVPPRSLLRDTLTQHGFSEAQGRPRADDVLVFWMRDKRLEIHCGIACGSSRFVHVEDGRDVEVARIDGWQHRLAAIYRMGSWQP